MNWSEEHIKELAELEQKTKSNTHRLDEHDKKLDELSNVYVALTKVDDKVSNVEKDVITIKTDLKDLKEKPIKRYEQVISLVITAIVTAILGFLLGKIGL